jgi:Leucine-rich repeat (LRR) protein
VDDGGVMSLSPLKSLQSLSLDSTLVTDAALDEVAALPNLRSLNLRATAITDAGVKKLARSHSLTDLDLTCCQQVSAEAIQDLKVAMPKCEIKCPQ